MEVLFKDTLPTEAPMVQGVKEYKSKVYWGKQMTKILCVLIKVLTNLKHFQSMPHSHAILCWIYIVLLSSSDV